MPFDKKEIQRIQAMEVTIGDLISMQIEIYGALIDIWKLTPVSESNVPLHQNLNKRFDELEAKIQGLIEDHKKMGPKNE